MAEEKKKAQHLLSIEQLTEAEIERYVDLAIELKRQRAADVASSKEPIAKQNWALIFSKSSTRTRVSFEVGIRELGGRAMYFSSRDLQLGRGEPIKDTARVMGRMIDGAIIRTYDQQDVVEFAEFSGVPTINALTDEEHPCQILADLMTMKELLGGWKGRTVAFLGDGDNNMSRSWMWAAERCGFRLVIGAPQAYQPSEKYLSRLTSGNIICEKDPSKAAEGADVLYTDVWVSMGQEEESARRIADLQAFQINDRLLEAAAKDAIVMHCLPAYREKEITEKVLEQHSDTIFQEAENRLHAQKAILAVLGVR
ncbi:MAG: ornithine carbamoyltransferase [Verrucomicrobia bacterium]|nr:ornithine carbamoyltransferase [Verrucomicrobiota bacterium]